MLVIFFFSSQPSDNLPDFDWADTIIKKGGHMLGYGMLALSYWYGFALAGRRRWLAWAMAILYASTDEFHQSFTRGRFPSVLDVLIFDNLGALISLWLADMYLKQKRPDKSPDRLDS
ncbi:MAG TPA: VanZ family protein, partial [Anaerolineales bacterium]|nr:VanZ family protein [Anaerolineales bacterium]